MKGQSEQEAHLLECILIASGYENWEKSVLQKPEIIQESPDCTSNDIIFRPNKFYPFAAPVFMLFLIWIPTTIALYRSYNNEVLFGGISISAFCTIVAFVLAKKHFRSDTLLISTMGIEYNSSSMTWTEIAVMRMAMQYERFKDPLYVLYLGLNSGDVIAIPITGLSIEGKGFILTSDTRKTVGHYCALYQQRSSSAFQSVDPNRN
jgi:hypothetical protein